MHRIERTCENIGLIGKFLVNGIHFDVFKKNYEERYKIREYENTCIINIEMA